MAEDYRAKKAYELLEKKRLANIAKNAEQGRTGIVSGMPAYDKTVRPDSLQGALDELRKQGKVTNLENTLKQTPTDLMGIDPAVRQKSKFGNLDKKLVGEVLDDVSDVARKESSVLGNSKGFAKMLPMLGLAGAGLAGLSIAGKVQAGELGEAGLETADLATDYIPGVGTLKMAARPTELGNAELPDEMMKERAIYNAARMGKNREPAVVPSEETPMLAPEDRVQKRDLDAMMQNILNRKR